MRSAPSISASVPPIIAQMGQKWGEGWREGGGRRLIKGEKEGGEWILGVLLFFFPRQRRIINGGTRMSAHTHAGCIHNASVSVCACVYVCVFYT